MKIKKIEDDLEKIRLQISELNAVCKRFNGLKIQIPYGKYKGRIGKIYSCYADPVYGVRALIQPIKLSGRDKGVGVLSDSLDSRTYWRLNDKMFG